MISPLMFLRLRCNMNYNTIDKNQHKLEVENINGEIMITIVSRKTGYFSSNLEYCFLNINTARELALNINQICDIMEKKNG